MSYLRTAGAHGLEVLRVKLDLLLDNALQVLDLGFNGRLGLGAGSRRANERYDVRLLASLHPTEREHRLWPDSQHVRSKQAAKTYARLAARDDNARDA